MKNSWMRFRAAFIELLKSKVLMTKISLKNSFQSSKKEKFIKKKVFLKSKENGPILFFLMIKKFGILKKFLMILNIQMMFCHQTLDSEKIYYGYSIMIKNKLRNGSCFWN